MNDERPSLDIFRSFREAKAPDGFTEKVMARVSSSPAPVSRRRFPWLGDGRWMWAGGLALAASLLLLVRQGPPSRPLSQADLSIYLADSKSLEEEADLGTEIEMYFL